MKQLGERIVLEDVTLDLHAGETVGLVGPNGAGKTTLFKLIARKLEPDRGTVTISRGLATGYLAQDPEITLDRRLHDEVIAGFADVLALEERMHALSAEMASASSDALENLMLQYDRVSAQFEAAGGYGLEQRVNEVLGGLGFRPSDYELPMKALSGGQRCRAALARLLLQQRQFLLLDEPTNHLDIDAVRWLERFLAGHHGGAVIISHDRYLLDRLADRIVALERGRVHSYAGNYTAYVRQKQRDALTRERQFEKDQAYIAKEREFIARHGAGQRSKEAQGRLKRLERQLESGEFVTDRPSERRQVALAFDAEVRQGRIVLEARDLAKRYGEKSLFTGLGLQVMTGDRLGITGPNGTGKSTLLKILLGEIDPDAGEVQRDSKSVFGYYRQDATEFDPERSILTEIQETCPVATEQQARGLLGRFLFTGEDVFKPLGRLSGGEQSRVRLVKLILQAPTVLVLDEPTNHLDIPSREALEEALVDYPGTILAVSHDRYFLDRIISRLLIIRGERHEHYNGNYSQYIEWSEQQAAKRAAQEATAPSRSTAGGRKAQRSGDAAKRPKSKFDKLSVEELEALIMQREEQVAALNKRFADPEIYKEPDRLATLKNEFDVLKAELAEIEAAWEARIG